MAWLRGEAYGSPTSILSMLSQLPEGSRFGIARHSGDTTESVRDLDPELEAKLDRAYWTGDRLLLAQLINSVNELLLMFGTGRRWKKGKEPKYPIVGPLAWHPPEQREKKSSASQTSVSERLRHAFGFGG